MMKNDKKENEDTFGKMNKNQKNDEKTKII